MSLKTLTLMIGAAAAAGLAFAPPAFAQGYGYRSHCTDRIHDNGTTGALLGGVAGALLGSNLAAHHGGRAGGALLGGAAGAALGSNIARSSTKDSCRGYYRGGEYGYRGYPTTYYDYPPPEPDYVYVRRTYYPSYVYAPSYYGGGYGEDWRRDEWRGHREWHGHHHHDHDDDDER